MEETTLETDVVEEEKKDNEPEEIVFPLQSDGLNLQSQDDEVQELLGHPPSWMLRYGITVMFIIVAGLLFLSAIVKYPDVVEAEVILTSSNPPITLYSKTTGKIEQLFVADQEEVEKGQLLMIIESEADYQDVLKAEQFILELKNKAGEISGLRLIKASGELNLGSIKDSYSSLLATLTALQYFLNDNAIFQKKKLYHGEISHTAELNQSIQNQLANYDKEIELEKKNFIRNEKLMKSGLVSAEDFEQIEKQFIQFQRNKEQLKMAVINNRITSQQLQSKIVDLESGRSAELSNYLLEMTEKMAMVEKEINEWQAIYLFYSTHDGRVSLNNFRVKKEFVNLLDPVLTIIPKDEVENKDKGIIARAKVDQFASGKIEAGNNVSILLESFPSREFGVLRSEVETIALLPTVDDEGKRFYTMDIPIAHPMVTTYDRSIPFRPNQSGLARITTKERSLAGRIFEQIMDLIKNT